MKELLSQIGGFVSSKLFLWIIGIALVIGGTLVVIAKNRDHALVTTGREAGAAAATVKGHETTLGQLKDANDAEQDIQSGGERNADRFAQCLQDSRRPAACERYRPLEH